MRLLKKILPLLLLCLIVLTGCSSLRKVELHPISQQDIIVVAVGETIKAPKDGVFLSNFYVEEVMRAKVGK